jgi:hypothetical protein
MAADSKYPPYLAVPWKCPLPGFCPVCFSPGEKGFGLTAREGIPFAVSFKLTLHIPYCGAHHRQLTLLQWRVWAALSGAILSPFAALMPALFFPDVNWHFSWMLYIGCIFSGICIGLALHYGRQLRDLRAVSARPMGQGPTYALRSSNPQWHQALIGLVEQYKKTHAPKNAVPHISI